MATTPVDPKAKALEELDDDSRAAYLKLEAGLTELEAKLPAECTEETQEVIGDIIKRSRRVEKFAGETYQQVCLPWNERIGRQRGLWKPIAQRAADLAEKAQKLVADLLRAAAKKREDDERAARELVAKKQREQAEAEARALAANTPEEQVAESKKAEEAWNETRKAVTDLDKAPATTAVKVGPATVYEAKHLDFEVLDIGAFATAHPELVEIRRGPTLTALRDATKGLTSLPETLAGWPGLKLKIAKKPASR